MRSWRDWLSFGLAVVLLVQGGLFLQLRQRVAALVERTTPGPAASPGEGVRAVARASRSAPPSFVAIPSSVAPTQEDAPLRDALASPGGRAALKSAMEALREEDRKERVLRTAPAERAQYELRWQQMLAEAKLTPDESAQLARLFADLAAARERILDDLAAGRTSARQAENELYQAQGGTERAARALFGKDREEKLSAGLLKHRAEARAAARALTASPP